MQSKEEVSLESKLPNHTNQSVRKSNLNTYRFSLRQDINKRARQKCTKKYTLEQIKNYKAIVSNR